MIFNLDRTATPRSQWVGRRNRSRPALALTTGDPTSQWCSNPLRVLSFIGARLQTLAVFPRQGSGRMGHGTWLLCAAVVLVGGCSDSARGLTPAQAEKALASLRADIAVTQARPGRVEVAVPGATSTAETLPDISTFRLTLDPERNDGAVVAEIFASTEKSGSGTDGWMVEVAKSFNAAGKTVAGGKPARIAVRQIASGTAYEYIASGKYRPEGFSPSNAVWAEMARAQGAEVAVVADRLVGNIAGVVMKTTVADGLKAGKPEIAVTDLVDAAIAGKLVLGYTNPFSSATGLNFLLTVLQTFAHGEESGMLSPDVASAFEQFQKSVPFVALTTTQMRDSVEQDRSLDAFVLEYQLYVQTPSLRSGYVFVPFGLRHDNPLYAVGPLSAEKREALERFAQYAQGAEPQALATRYGFNPTLAWSPPFEAPTGKTAIAAQRLWKQRKDAGRPIAAVFLADVSGSMAGSRIEQLRQSLIDGGGFISPDNAIGLATFSSQVTVQLPIRPFQLLHKAAFQTAARRLEAGGDTAMYNGVVAALQMLVDYRKANPESRPMLFVLTDGETNRGLTFDKVEAIVAGLGIPVYTVGFDADIGELGRLSGLVESATLNASEADLRYKLGALLNAQM